MPGTWSVATDFQLAITVKQGLEEALGNNGTVLYAKGSNLMDDPAYEERATMFDRSLKKR